MWKAFRPSGLLVCALLLSAWVCLWSTPVRGQTPPPSPYPDNKGGLEKLAKEIQKAESRGEAAHLAALTKVLLLPDPFRWYSSVFDESTADSLARSYEAGRAAFPGQLAEFFHQMHQLGFIDVRALRFEDSCDDASGEQTYGVLFARDAPVPLYELRLEKDRSFRRLWALAYVDGAFRYVSFLRPPSRLVQVNPISPPEQAGGKKEEPKRITVNKDLSEAKLIHQVKPEYPDVALQERLEGTVNLHAIIGTDGTLRAMQVVRGYCSLAKAAVAAVRKWRYSPTLIGGRPVEVETFIDVVYQFSH